jgi:Domain of unknown function (DUF4272)
MRRAGVEPDEDAELFVPPPDADAVARRAAIVGTVVIRGVTELEEAGADFAYFDELDLARDAEPQELEVIRTPHGTLPQQATIDAHWRAEGLAVLTWALGLLDELPPIDETIHLGVLAERIGWPWASAADVAVLRSPRMARSPDEIDALGVRLLTAHWRVRQFMHISQEPMDYVAWVPDAQWAELSLDGLEVADRDLAIRGEPITRADEDLVHATSSILVERRIAVSWLQGYDELYSEGDTST